MLRIKGTQRVFALLTLCMMVFSSMGTAFSLIAYGQSQMPVQQAPDKIPSELAQIQEAQNPDETKSAPVNGPHLRIPLPVLGDIDGYTLKTVKTERLYYFTRPQGWGIQPSSHINVVFQHSPNLLPERSSLNVKINNRILKTIPLAKDNVSVTRMRIPIPPEILKDENTLSFQVDQHYTYQCEDPFSEELWTTLLPETYLQMDYKLLPAKTDLARFPYPLFDPLGYGETVVYFGVPDNLSSESLTALGITTAGIAQYAGWRQYRTELVSPSQYSSIDGNMVLIGTPEENSAIGSLNLPVSVSSLGAGEGAIMMVPNPSRPSKAILVVTGKDPKGVMAAANVLSQKPVNKLLVGRSAVIKEWNTGLKHPYRAWDGFVQKTGTTFAQLGFKTESTRGITATALYYNLKIMPDVFLPGRTKGKLRTVYSYSSQLDPKQSKLEVRLNGKAIASVPLDKREGEHQKELVIEVPSEQMYTYNDLEYQFYLYPDKFDICNFVTDAHIWGTVHNTSSVEFPGDIRTPLPDVGLLNDGAYPFTAYPDMSQTSIVLPDNPSQNDLRTMMKILTRIGRLSPSKTGFQLTVYRGNAMDGNAKSNNHLIMVGNNQNNSTMKEIDSKLRKLVVENGKATLSGNDAKLATLAYDSSQGVLEEILSPWNNSRVVLLVYGESDEAYRRIQTLFDDDRRFKEITPGNLVVVNSNGEPQSVTALNKGEARFFYEDDMTEGWKMPIWGWILLAFFSLLGIIAFLRFLFGR